MQKPIKSYCIYLTQQYLTTIPLCLSNSDFCLDLMGFIGFTNIHVYIDSVNSRTNAIEYYKVHRIHGSSIHTMTKSRMIKRIMKEKTVMICNDM